MTGSRIWEVEVTPKDPFEVAHDRHRHPVVYPTHEDYVAAVTDSAEAAVSGGFLRQAEGDAFITDAEDAAVPS